MIKPRALVFGLALPVTLALAPAANAQEAVAATDVMENQCVATVEPVAVPVQAEPVTLGLELPEALGERLSALLEEESGVEVVEVAAAQASEGEQQVQKISVKLNTSAATAGEWTITLASESGRRCSGKITIQAGESR